MSAYYNEHDKKTAAWLRQLVSEGHIADGVVDDRDIQEVTADELRKYNQVHLFAGIGGWSYALRLAGWPDDRPVWTGSCPCQPFSAAGKRKGESDERHLWPEMRRLLAELRPAAVFGEQVASGLGREWLAGVRADMEALGYAFGAADLCAAGIGSPHIRQRLFWVADAQDMRRNEERADGYRSDKRTQTKRKSGRTSERRSTRGLADAEGCIGRLSVLERRQEQASAESEWSCEACGLGDADDAGLEGRQLLDSGRGGQWPAGSASHWHGADSIPCGDGKTRRIEPGVSPLVDGVPARVVRLRGYGNAIVPQVAATFVSAHMGTEARASK